VRRIGVVALTLVVGLALGILGAMRWQGPAAVVGLKPEVSAIAAASLDAVRAQNRLTAFAARFTVDVTSTARTPLGLTAQKTMIVPGTVRYELDWTKVGQQDLRWDAATRTLSVTLPGIELSEPQVDLARIREYSQGRTLMALTDAEDRLDASNRAQIREALLREARRPVLAKLARDATRAAVERSFVLPLSAAGVEARVIARFPDETGAAM
jgi:hypothetical protein